MSVVERLRVGRIGWIYIHCAVRYGLKPWDMMAAIDRVYGAGAVWICFHVQTRKVEVFLWRKGWLLRMILDTCIV